MDMSTLESKFFLECVFFFLMRHFYYVIIVSISWEIPQALSVPPTSPLNF